MANEINKTRLSQIELICLMDKLKREGHIRLEGTMVIGRAADGVEVQIGDSATAADKRALASYFYVNPTPAHW